MLPVFWNENYVTLLSGEPRTLNVGYEPAKSRLFEVPAGAFNNAEHTTPSTPLDPAFIKSVKQCASKSSTERKPPAVDPSRGSTGNCNILLLL